jgi:hypothetical protein
MAEVAGHAHLTAMVQHDVLHNGETEPGAASLAGAGFIHAIETLEQAGKVFGRNSGSEIAHVEFDIFLALDCPNLDFLAARGIFQSVIDKVGEDLMNRVFVSQNLEFGRLGYLNGEAFIFATSLKMPGVAEQLAGGDGDRLEAVFA